MAVALRPAVLLIVVASLLFFAAGYLDTAAATTDVSTYASWAFGAVNLLVALLIARGNERMLALRIGLAAFFVVERPVTAIAFGPKPVESVAMHMATAVLEAVILFSTLRIWRLGHSVGQADLAFLDLRSAPLAAAAGMPGGAADLVGAPIPGVVAPKGKREKREQRTAAVKAAKPLDTRPKPTWGFRVIGLLALLLAVALIGQAALRGVVPGASIDLGSTEWLGYLFALVVLVVASRAVHQGRFAVRLLLVVALIVFIERAFAPFATGSADAASYGTSLAGALVALALAIACAASLRATRPRRSALPL
jgi:hypothetical protein